MRADHRAAEGISLAVAPDLAALLIRSAYPESMPLLLGPILRHVGDTTASIWVQTSTSCEVTVLGCRAQTFEVQGHHYALVLVDGLSPDSTYDYEVSIDDDVVWPEADSTFPRSVIRTQGPRGAVRKKVIFGSCRYPKTGEPKIDEKLGTDALDSYAKRLATVPVDQWPDVLILLGDQVYADELTPQARAHLAGRRRGSVRTKRPPDEVVSFREYESLYRHTWSDPEIRWIMSTISTAMIFDDHDIRDDWNTSAVWRAEMASIPWWPDRIRAGLASYWVYQHIGNLSADTLRDDPDYRAIVTGTGDRWPVLADLADRADAEVDGSKGVRFSFRWDLGRSRLLMIDSRNGRILTDGHRSMLGEREFDWLADQIADAHEDVDHLMLGTSLPWLLPYAVSDLQTINELAAGRPGWRGRLGEKIRQAADFEHWPAFFDSFVRLTELIVGASDRPAHPLATVTVLSGDVHHSYAARVDLPTTTQTSVYQLVCSPVHNHVPAYVRPVLTYGWSSRVGKATRAFARRWGSRPLPVRWTNVAGPLFGNTIATLELDGRDARVTFDQPDDHGDLVDAASVRLD